MTTPTTATEALYRATSLGVKLSLSSTGKISVEGPPGAVAEIRPALVEHKAEIVRMLEQSDAAHRAAFAAWSTSPPCGASPATWAAITWLTDLLAVPGRLEAACGPREALLAPGQGEREVKRGNRSTWVKNEPRWINMRATAQAIWQGMLNTAPGSVDRAKALAAAVWLHELWRGDGAIGWRSGEVESSAADGPSMVRKAG